MKKIQLLLMLGIVSLLASCGEKALTFSNYEKNADAQWPDGVPASLELTLAIPQGESEVQEKVTAAIKEIVSRSRIAEELGTPEGETLEAIADNYHKRFMKGITEGELEAPCVYHLQITSPYSNSQCAVLQVSDGVYGNGGPTEYVWNVRLSDGRLMPFNEISTMNRSKLLNLAQQFANEDDKEDIKLNLEDFWLYPTAEGCKVKAQTGTHFFKDFVVPMENVEPYLTSEGKKLFGVETEGTMGKAANEDYFLTTILDKYKELLDEGYSATKIERLLGSAYLDAKEKQLAVTGSPYGISCSTAVINTYNVQDDCINIIMELVPDEGTDFHLDGPKGMVISSDNGPYGKFVQAQAYCGEELLYARTCHCYKGKMLVTLIMKNDALQLWEPLDRIHLVEKK